MVVDRLSISSPDRFQEFLHLAAPADNHKQDSQHDQHQREDSQSRIFRRPYSPPMNITTPSRITPIGLIPSP